MLQTFKKLLFLSVILLNSTNLISEENPYIFIENNSQKMVMALKDNKSLFGENRELYESKIIEIFEPMIVPIGISPASLNMLEIPMNISGADVPNAINVRPMSKSLIPNLLARLDE